MKRVLLFVLSCILLQSCITNKVISSSTVGLNEEDLKIIPPESKVISAHRNDIDTKAMYEEVITILLLRGHRIEKEDKERLYIITVGKDVGQSTIQRVTIFISTADGVTTARISSDWHPGMDAMVVVNSLSKVTTAVDWLTAKWEDGRPGMAFAEGYAIAKAIKNTVITFER